jgi:hypothetical protein
MRRADTVIDVEMRSDTTASETLRIPASETLRIPNFFLWIIYNPPTLIHGFSSLELLEALATLVLLSNELQNVETHGLRERSRKRNKNPMHQRRKGRGTDQNVWDREPLDQKSRASHHKMREESEKKIVTRTVPALANGNSIAFLDGGKSRGAVSRNVGVALLETVVFADVVEIVTTDDDSALHLGRDNSSTQNTATDGNIAGEGALLVNVGASRSSLRGLEAQTDVANITRDARGSLLVNELLSTKENGGLSLEGTLVLKYPY